MTKKTLVSEAGIGHIIEQKTPKPGQIKSRLHKNNIKKNLVSEGGVGHTIEEKILNIVDRRSYTGYAFMFSGSAVCLQARKQIAVALYSTETEYLALSEATKELLI